MTPGVVLIDYATAWSVSGSADEMEHNLARIQQLIEMTMSAHRRRTSVVPFTGCSGESMAAAAERLIPAAKGDVAVMISGNGGEAHALYAAIGRAVPRIRTGTTLRLLCPARLPAGTAHRPDCEVRVTAAPLQEAVILGGRLVLAHADSGDGAPQAAVIRIPLVVRALESLFAAAWTAAVPLDAHLRLGPRAHADTSRRVLEHLRSGSTDDVAARELNVSLRTYRRHVAEIMRGLGASSRFQAGVRAIELGLLPPLE